MKNKLVLLFLTAFFGIFFLHSYNQENFKKVDSSSLIVDHSDRFKKDMLESIMEFSNDGTPIDSLYIPEWLMKEDSVISPILD